MHRLFDVSPPLLHIIPFNVLEHRSYRLIILGGMSDSCKIQFNTLEIELDRRWNLLGEEAHTDDSSNSISHNCCKTITQSGNTVHLRNLNQHSSLKNQGINKYNC